MARRIDIDDVEFDAAAAKLGDIGKVLQGEQRLQRTLADDIPGDLGTKVLEVVAKAKHTAEEVGKSCHRQAGELTNRAVFARIADDRATENDVKMLVAMSAGKHAIDLDKRKSYRFLLGTLQKAIMDIGVRGGKDGKMGPFDDALVRWEHWRGLQVAGAGNTTNPPPRLTYSQLYKEVFGVAPPKTTTSIPPAAPPVDPSTLSGGVAIDPAVAPQGPNVNRSQTVTAGESSQGGSVRGPGHEPKTQTMTAGPSTQGGSVRGNGNGSRGDR